MAYSPYKMKGHTLPGIKQRKDSEYGELSKGKRSPNKFWQALVPIAGKVIGGMMSKNKEK